MSDRTETLLRDLFAADADNAPLPRNLAVAARQRVSHRRRRLAVVSGAMTVVVALAIGAAAVALPRSEKSLPADRGWTGPKGVVAFHGVEVTLPASIQESRCGRQTGAIVVGPQQFGSCSIQGKVAGGQRAPAAVSNDSGHYTVPTQALVDLFWRWAPSPYGSPAGYQDASTPDSLCSSNAEPGQTVMTAYATTVGEVRRWAIGPTLTPAAKPWATLKPETQAAWCELRTTSGYAVIAATYEHPSVQIITSKELSLAPEGPQVP